MDAIKIDDNTLEVTKQEPTPAPTVTKYERSFIEQQIKNIQAQKDRDNALRDAELKECQNILDEMDKQGVVAKQKENV